MNRIFQLFALLILAALLFGCATKPHYVNVDKDQPKALIKGKQCGLFDIGGTWIYIDAVDDTPIPHTHILGEYSSVRATPVYVSPGNHDILLDVVVQGQMPCSQKLSVTFDAGHTYEARARRKPFGELHFLLMDETSNQIIYEVTEPYGNSVGGRIKDILQFLPTGGGSL